VLLSLLALLVPEYTCYRRRRCACPRGWLSELAASRLWRARFTCFASANVQILTPTALSEVLLSDASALPVASSEAKRTHAKAPPAQSDLRWQLQQVRSVLAVLVQQYLRAVLVQKYLQFDLRWQLQQVRSVYVCTSKVSTFVPAAAVAGTQCTCCTGTKGLTLQEYLHYSDLRWQLQQVRSVLAVLVQKCLRY
jgi:hypothetical protein